MFAQIKPNGSRLTELAAGANITAQSMGQIVDELEELGYVRRQPDPDDRRAKLITLTEQGHAAVAAGESAITGIEEDLVNILGPDRAALLRDLLITILDTPTRSPNRGRGKRSNP